MSSTVRFTSTFRASLLALALVVCAPAPTIAQIADDPAKLAQMYDRQAADFRAQAARHTELARRHMGGPGTAQTADAGIVQHCERIAEALSSAARESEALANRYRSLLPSQAR